MNKDINKSDIFSKMYKEPRAVIAVFALIALFSLSQIFNWTLDWHSLFKIELDADFKNMLPTDIQSKIDSDRLEAVFGGSEIVYILLETDDVLKADTLKRVENFSQSMANLSDIEQTMSLFDIKNISRDNKGIHAGSAIESIPQTEESREKLRSALMSNDFARKVVISEDSTVTIMIGMVAQGVEDSAVRADLEAIVQKYPGDEKLYLGGIPYVRSSIIGNMASDMLFFMPTALVLMLIFLGFFFRQARGVILPFVVVIFAIQVSMALVHLLGWKLQLPMMLAPVILIAVANDYGIHMIARYQEELLLTPSLTNKEVALKVARSLGKPVLFTGITTIGGFLTLLTNDLTAAKHLAVLAAVGVAYALIASIFFIPAVISILPAKLPKLQQNEEHGLNRALTHLGNFVVTKSRKIIVWGCIITVVVGLGAFKIYVDANPESYYAEDDPLNVGVRLVDEKLGGTQNIALLIEGDIASSAVMQRIDSYEEQAKKLSQVDQTSSIATFIRQISKIIHQPGDAGYDAIPTTDGEIKQYLALYEKANQNAKGTDKFIDADYQQAQLMIRLNDPSSESVHAALASIKTMVANDDSVTAIGGWAVILDTLVTLIIGGQIRSLILSLIVIAALVAILFKSWKAGLFGIIPLFVSLFLVFGLMGYFNLTLNIATAMFSSILVGIGVDYTIHFLWRYKEELATGMGYEKAVCKTLETTGRGIIFNGLSVILGFIVLFFSKFQPIEFFGLCLFISITSCLIGALVLVPALCLVAKPRFLEPVQAS